MKEVEYIEHVVEHSMYGNCILRSFNSNVEYEFFRRMNRAFPNHVPPIFEYYQFNTLGPKDVMRRLIEMGFPTSIKPVGSFSNGNIGLLKYVGVPLVDGILYNEENLENVKKILTSFAETMGELHRFGVIANDTHEKQFTVDENFKVWRIDAGNPYLYKEKAINNVSLATFLDVAELHGNLISDEQKFKKSVQVEFAFFKGILEGTIQYFGLNNNLETVVLNKYYQLISK